MAQGSQVPPYGNRGSDEQSLETKSQNGPKPIRSKHERSASRDGGKMWKLTDSPVSNKSDSEPPKGLDAAKPRHERRLSRDESESRKSTDSPLRPVNVGPRGTTDSPIHRQSGINNNTDSPKQVTPRHGNKNGAVSSPLSERKGASESSNGPTPLTPGRSRLRSVTRGDESPDDSPTVPKFGDWDDNDPASGEGFTQVFERVREEKHSGGGGKVPAMANEASYANGQKRYRNDTPKGCGCFPWGGK